jgi:hypothetical protein
LVDDFFGWALQFKRTCKFRAITLSNFCCTVKRAECLRISNLQDNKRRGSIVSFSVFTFDNKN